MTPAQLAAKVLANKWTWIVLISLLIILLSRGTIKRLLAQLQRQDRGNYDTRLNEGNPRTAELEALATNLFAAIDGIPAWNDQRPELFEQALAINDTELRYVSQFYKQISGGNTLRTDVNGEFSVVGESKPRLVARLLKLNL